MKKAVFLLAAMLILPARAANDASLTRMALCRDSWMDWSKSDPARMKAFAGRVRAQFSPHGNDAYMLPKAKMSVMGLRVLQAFPQSVGTGVGFSLTVDAGFGVARKAVENALGKALQHCESSDGMESCTLEVAPQRTITLMAEDTPKNRQTLIGCYYLYER